jgi:hypothetical protein
VYKAYISKLGLNKQQFEVENFVLTAELDFVGGWVGGKFVGSVGGWVGVQTDLRDCLAQPKKSNKCF